MARTQQARSAKKATGKVGSRVSVYFGSKKMKAVVIEDIGPVGVRGRRLVRVRLLSKDDTREFDLPLEELSPAPPG